MALSWLWLVALFFMSLLFPSVLATIEYSSSNQDLLSPEELPLIKRGQSLQCTYGEDPCGYGCCDGSVRCFYFQYQLASCCVTDVQCPAFMNVSLSPFLRLILVIISAKKTFHSYFTNT